MSSKDQDLQSLKIVIVGESGVGKSNIISRFAYNKFCISANMTVGIQFVSKKVMVGSQEQQEQVLLELWDTAGQQKFRALNRAFYRNALGAVIVFSVGERTTFDNVPKWIQQLREHTHQNLIMILVGNKCDLKERQVSVDEASEYAHLQKMAYLQTSAALNINIERIFSMLGEKIYQIYKNSKLKRTQKRTSVLSVIGGNKRPKGKCCE